MPSSEITTKVYPRLAGGICGDPAVLTGVELAKRVLEFASPPVVKAAADSMAADATALTKFWTNPFEYDVYLESVELSPAAALTANDTNYASILFLTDDAADSTPAAAATFATQITAGTGNLVTDIAKNPSSYTAAARTIKPGASLFWQITKTGTGVVVPAFVAVACLRKT